MIQRIFGYLGCNYLFCVRSKFEGHGGHYSRMRTGFIDSPNSFHSGLTKHYHSVIIRLFSCGAYGEWLILRLIPMRFSRQLRLAKRFIAALLCLVWLCQTGVYPAVLAMLEGFEQNHSVNVQWASGSATVTLHHSAQQQCHQHDLMERFVMLWADDTAERDHVIKTVGSNLDLKDSLRVHPRTDVQVFACWWADIPAGVKVIARSAVSFSNRTWAAHDDFVRLQTVQMLI